MGTPGSRRVRPPISGPRSATFAGFVFVFVAYALALGQAIFLSEKFYEHQSPHAITLLFARYLIALFRLIPLGICLYRFRSERSNMIPDFTSWKPVRLFLYSIFLAIVTTSLVASSGLLGSSRFLLEQFFIAILLLTLGLWALGAKIDPALLPSALRRVVGLADIALANLLVGLVLAGSCAEHRLQIFHFAAAVGQPIYQGQSGKGATSTTPALFWILAQ